MNHGRRNTDPAWITGWHRTRIEAAVRRIKAVDEGASYAMMVGWMLASGERGPVVVADELERLAEQLERTVRRPANDSGATG